MIEATFTIKQVRKLLRALNGPSVTDPDIASIYNYFQRELDNYNIDANKSPWRKVVGQHGTGVFRYEDLECGHRYRLRQSSRAGSGWIEDHAKKRRCKHCQI